MAKVLVSVLVLSYNEAHRLAKLKGQLAKLSGGFRLEVILADNGSTDGTLKLARKFGWKVSRSEKNIGTPIYNHALRKASGKYLFFIQNDMGFHRDCLKLLYRELSMHPETAVAAPKLLNYYDHSKVSVAGSWLSRSFYAGSIRDSRLKKRTEIPFYGTGLLRLSQLEKAGGYVYHPDYFLYGEDVDLGLRLRMAGYKTVFVPDAIVYDMGSQSEKLFSREQLTFFVERNQLRNILQDLQLSTIALYLPFAVAMRALAIAKDALRLDFARALARLKAIWWNAANIGEILRERKKVQKMRRVPDAEFSYLFDEAYLSGIIARIAKRK